MLSCTVRSIFPTTPTGHGASRSVRQAHSLTKPPDRPAVSVGEASDGQPAKTLGSVMGTDSDRVALPGPGVQADPAVRTRRNGVQGQPPGLAGGLGRQAGGRHLRSRRVRQDGPCRRVGGAGPAAVCVAVDRRARQRPGRAVDLPRGWAGPGRADRPGGAGRPGLPGRLHHPDRPSAAGGRLVQQGAPGGDGPGRCAPAP